MTLLAEKKLAKRKDPLQKIPKPHGGGHFTGIVDAKGGSHAYLNAAVPTTPNGEPIAPIYTAICEVCGHAYSHLMGSGTCGCDECRGDRAARRAMTIQEVYGIYLGWKQCDLLLPADKPRLWEVGDLMTIRSRRNMLAFCPDCGGDVYRGECRDCMDRSI